MIEQIYIDALLSAAAYAKWDKSESEITINGTINGNNQWGQTRLKLAY